MDPLRISGLTERLASTRWQAVHFHETIGSTQDAALSGPSGCSLHWADQQTKGRGRQGRRWDDGGQDIAVTFRLEDWPVTRPELLALVTPVAITTAGEEQLELAGAGSAAGRLRCKWPNDVLAEDGAGGLAKLAGVLIDGSGQGGEQPVWRIGIGLNVNRRRFPRDLDQPATSLAHLAGRDLDRCEVLLALAVQLDRWLNAAMTDPTPLFSVFQDRLYGMGRTVQIAAGARGTSRDSTPGLKRGKLLGIGADGLQLEGQPPIPLAHVTRILI